MSRLVKMIFALEKTENKLYNKKRMKKRRKTVVILQESGEMYLETLYILSRDAENVRSLDIAEYRGFSKPSVSRAVGLLQSGGFITVDAKGYLHLTQSGKEKAEKIFERHTLITDFLTSLGVPRETAEDDACKIEHDISDISFEAIKKHYENSKE